MTTCMQKCTTCIDKHPALCYAMLGLKPVGDVGAGSVKVAGRYPNVLLAVIQFRKHNKLTKFGLSSDRFFTTFVQAITTVSQQHNGEQSAAGLPSDLLNALSESDVVACGVDAVVDAWWQDNWAEVEHAHALAHLISFMGQPMSNTLFGRIHNLRARADFKHRRAEILGKIEDAQARGAREVEIAEAWTRLFSEQERLVAAATEPSSPRTALRRLQMR